MIPDIERTIVALASGARPAPRAIVRLAGPHTRSVLCKLCRLSADEGVLCSTRLTWAVVQCDVPEIGRSVPASLLYWPDSRSYTGQPAAELHLIGSLPLAEALIARCCQIGAQPAQRGEFTLRAFLAGKLDLAQAEAVLGVIEADSPASLKAALTQLGGNLAPQIKPLRDVIVHVVAELEAGLDFVDEDIEFISQSALIAQLVQVLAQLKRFAARLETRSSTNIVPKVVLAGLPNSGKSSLFNALCQQPLAIVTDQAGTTRDYLQQRMSLAATEFDLIDTAGWEDLQDDSPRAMAQQQLLACLAEADICLLCIDMTHECDWQALESALAKINDRPKQWLLVGTKLDCPDARPAIIEDAAALLHSHFQFANQPIATSSHSRQGLNSLCQLIATCLKNDPDLASPIAVVHHTAVRCRAALTAARIGLEAALNVASVGGAEEFIAAELRLVLEDLSTIIGEVHSDDILGEIFSRFCIGK